MAEFDEQERIAALHAYDILDTPTEQSFDEIVQAAARVCGAPIAAISFVDVDRQWFKAQVGLTARETPRNVSFCQHAMLKDDIYVVDDASRHPLFAENALVTSGPQIRFYAGAPLKSASGLPLGALCVIDDKPRPQGLTEDQKLILRVLARQVETQLSLRSIVRDQSSFSAEQAVAIAAAAGREARLMNAFDAAEIGWWDWDIVADHVVANEVLAQTFGVAPGLAAQGAPLRTFFAYVHPEDSVWLESAINECIETGAAFREEYRLLLPGGKVRWTLARGRCILDEAGKPVRFPGVAIDITDRKAAEEQLREASLGRELAMQAAQLGRFDHNPSTGARFYDKRALAMVGLSLEDIQDPQVVLGRVHPKDRPRMVKALTAAIDPRRSGPFRQTYRIINPDNGEVRWLNAVGSSEFSNGVCTRFMGVFEDVTEAKVAEEHRRLLVNELNHRVKNTLAVLSSLVDTSLRKANATLDLRTVIMRRIQAFSKAQDILTADNWSAAPVPAIVAGVVASLSLPEQRLEISGPSIKLGPQPALQLSLALNELSTNALKYGALSNDSGRVTMTWGVDGQGDHDAVFHFDWTEHGGPPVAPPTRRGFGTSLIERATKAAFQGVVSLSYAPAGVHWSLRAPVAGLAESGRVLRSYAEDEDLET